MTFMASIQATRTPIIAHVFLMRLVVTTFGISDVLITRLELIGVSFQIFVPIVEVIVGMLNRFYVKSPPALSVILSICKVRFVRTHEADFC